ncbi:bifunctional diaminohydroxyphosphoribosylaminopyrimidine deaminase/5-amino-6-(5-phosphoribosylamino)uracil reductase RibD [bacterium]|nr:bifunctional diaminohydroxyphosphoribosylaminopyrimidine deaminase/5-amino-6-(5-phosphoribosylamino)uracil reductase RibD [bacterium]
MNPEKKNNHVFYMKQAVSLAKCASRKVSPNPRVGAVLVKDGKIIGQGYHKCAGASHAEIQAIESAGKDANGSTLYVTLEPCSSYGKTPPCTYAVIKAGIKKVFIGVTDPNPAHNGIAVNIFKQHNIGVETGILKNKCAELIEDFRKFIIKKLPFVTVKAAISIDGKIATFFGESKWITSPASRSEVQKIRSSVDAVLVGSNTIAKDNPSLTVRTAKGKLFQPWRIVLDPYLSIPHNCNIVTDYNKNRTVLVVDKQKAEIEKFNFFIKNGIKIFPLATENGFFNPMDVLRSLTNLSIVSLLVEGGGETIGTFFDHKLIDKLYIFIAPKIIGGKTAPGPFNGKGIKNIAEAVYLQRIKWRKFKDDMMFCGYPVWNK